MIIPDYISPVVGYRVWSWDTIGLKSLNGELWMPGQRLSAACRTLAGRAEDGLAVHDAPQMTCTCGVYAAKSLDCLRALGYMGYGSIYGELYLWGTVVEHQLGWRAQYAYPKNFTLPLDMVPLSMGAAESRLTTLAAYACDIYIHRQEETIPLWHADTGYDSVGLDLLIRRCESWYARRKEERRIKPSDRVAVLGHGIAVVEQADDDQVHAVLWSRDMMRIGRKEIVWDEQNMRWEAVFVAGESKAGRSTRICV
jgi:hypothetical protein